MTYPGDTSLSDDIKERILSTFEQALDLTDSGSRKEALLGCDFVLRLDPLFEPARILHKRLRSDESEISTEDLREAIDGDVAASLDAIDEAAAELEPADIIEPPPAPEPEQTYETEEPEAEAEPREEGPAEPAAASFRDAVEEALESSTEEAPREDEDDLAAVEVAEPEPSPPATSQSETPDLDEGESESTAEPVGSETVATTAEELEESEPSSGTETEPTDLSLGADDDLDDEMSEPLGGSTQLDEESRKRIADLLDEGQDAYDAGEYQSAIDAWSRIFLIDIDHAEANERIEQARRMSAEVERQVEEVFHEAMAALDSGDLDEAREALHRVLDLQPGHLAAKDYLDRIESGEALPSGATAPAEGATLTPAGFDLKDTNEVELDQAPPGDESEQLFTTPELTEQETVGQATAPMPTAPKATQGPRRSFLIVGSAVLAVVLLGGWWLLDNWDLFFPNSQAAQPANPAPRIDPIARAKTLHEQGKTAIAIAQLRRLPPGDPSYAEAQALVAQWETPEGEDEPSGPSEAQRQAQEALVDRAQRALAAGENLLTVDLLERAAAIAPLDAETAAMRESAREALEPLREQIQVFRAGDWEYALPTLWRLREQDNDNRDVNRLIVDSYYNLGVRDLQRGRPEAALRKFEEALSVRPGDAVLERLAAFAETYADERPEDLLYRIFVKYLPFR